MNYEVITETNNLSRAEWLEERKKGLGGSDAGVILGVNKWKTLFQLYLEKTGEYTEEINNEFIYWGNELEDIVAREFEKRSGKKVEKLEKMLRHPEHEFMTANLDRIIAGEDALLECKTASAYSVSEWEGEEVPAAYLCQVQHYLAVTGFKTAYIAVLCGGNNFIWKEIPRDDELIEYLIEQEKAFWEEHVLAEQPPAIDGSEAGEEFLKKLYPEEVPDSEISLGNEVEQMLEAIEQLTQDIKEFTAQKKEYENRIKVILGDNEKGRTAKRTVTWKSYQSNKIDAKRLKAEKPDLYKEYTNTTTARRFTVK